MTSLLYEQVKNVLTLPQNIFSASKNVYLRDFLSHKYTSVVTSRTRSDKKCRATPHTLTEGH